MLLFLLTQTSGFYLPGVAPRDYEDGEVVDVKVNKLDSVKTQLPYDYYSLPFCRPDNVEEVAENLGEILSGDMIQSSAYEVSMKVPLTCSIICRKEYTDDELRHFAEKIAEDYRVNWVVDNLPATTKGLVETTEVDANGGPVYVTHYEKGFPLGFIGSPDIPNTVADVAYVNNHVRLIIQYHTDPATFKGSRVVGFEIDPFSVKHKVLGEWKGPGLNTLLSTCRLTSGGVQPQPVSGPLKTDDKVIIWTYDVEWEHSPVKWASRWDVYLKMTDSQIHWFSIINSIVIVLFLSGMVAMIMIRTLHRDFLKYNSEMTEEERIEESGWKKLAGDVFRAPARAGFLSILVGTGAQVFAMTLVTLVFAVLGFLSPANRGGLMTALLLVFVFMGMLAGYYSTKFYRKVFGLTEWKRNTLLTALFFPGVMFLTFFVLNLFVWGEKSSGAVPFGTLVALLVLWLGISLPLVYLGSYFAFKQADAEFPVKPSQYARPPPLERPWYTHPQVSILIGGVLPFGAVFIEIFFIMSSIWLHQYYYVFGFLLLVFVILIITCAEISIVLCYFQLCNDDYHWWWRSYLTSGSSAVYLFLYSVLYFFTKLEIVKFVSGLLFFGYMLLVSFAFFILTGTIGFVACYNFVWKIYSSIKLE